MPTRTITRRQAKTADKSRESLIEAFWKFTSDRSLLKDSERLLQIKKGVSANLIRAVRVAFDLQERKLEELLNASISTLERCRRAQRPLDFVASERLDRIAAVCLLAEGVLESRDAVLRWMSNPNQSLGGGTPVLLSETEIGSKQVRRVLRALDWGDSA